MNSLLTWLSSENAISSFKFICMHVTLEHQAFFSYAYSLHVSLILQELEQKSQQSTEDEQSPGVLSFVPPSQPLVRIQTKPKCRTIVVTSTYSVQGINLPSLLVPSPSPPSPFAIQHNRKCGQLIIFSVLCEAIIEGLRAKRAYIAFLADFHFLQDRANFWQTDLFWHEKHCSVIVSVDLRFVLQK